MPSAKRPDAGGGIAGCEAGRAALPAIAFLIALLTALGSLGQLATSMYLPSVPSIGRLLGAGEPAVHAVLWGYLAAFAVMQLVLGPVSDRIGRRPVLLGGLALFVAATALCAAAPTIEVLIGARVLQGVGACAGMVVARALMRDLFEGARLARTMAYFSAALAIVPGVAPFVGGLLEDAVGWRASFVLAGVIGAAVMLAVLMRLPETNFRAGLAIGRPASPWRTYGEVLRSGPFVLHSVTTALALAAMFTIMAGSPALFREHLGTSASEYGTYPLLAVAGYFAGSIGAGRLATRVRGPRLIMFGLLTMVAGALVMLLPAFSAGLDVPLAVLAWTVFVAGLGFVMPIGAAASIQGFPHCAGAASAVLGFLQMAGAALGTGLVAALSHLGPQTLPVALAFVTASALVWFLAGSYMYSAVDRARGLEPGEDMPR